VVAVDGAQLGAVDGATAQRHARVAARAHGVRLRVREGAVLQLELCVLECADRAAPGAREMAADGDGRGLLDEPEREAGFAREPAVAQRQLP
jgi:hypothetical protein